LGIFHGFTEIRSKLEGKSGLEAQTSQNSKQVSCFQSIHLLKEHQKEQRGHASKGHPTGWFVVRLVCARCQPLGQPAPNMTSLLHSGHLHQYSQLAYLSIVVILNSVSLDVEEEGIDGEVPPPAILSRIT